MSETLSETRGRVWSGSVRVRIVEFGQNGVKEC